MAEPHHRSNTIGKNPGVDEADHHYFLEKVGGDWVLTDRKTGNEIDRFDSPYEARNRVQEIAHNAGVSHNSNFDGNEFVTIMHGYPQYGWPQDVQTDADGRPMLSQNSPTHAMKADDKWKDPGSWKIRDTS